MRFFLPTYVCTHGPGEDPFEAVVCAVRAASQISCSLLKKTFVSYTKHHLNLNRNFIYKRYILKRYTVIEILQAFWCGSFSPEMRSWSLTKVLCYKFTSYFLECCYWPGGSSLHIQDGDTSKYVLYVSHIKKSGLFLTSTMRKLKMVFLRRECFL